MKGAAANALELGLQHLRSLQRAGRHAEALRDLPVLLRDAPENRELLLISAISLRNLGRVAEALAVLEKLGRREPRFSRLHQERGLCFAARGDKVQAIGAFEQAVSVNPALIASWSALENLNRVVGNAETAAIAHRHATFLQRLPQPILAATSLLSDGEMAPAEVLLREFIAHNGEHPEAFRLLARIARAHDALEDAEALLERVLLLAPDYHAARYDLAEVLLRLHRHARAHVEIGRALQTEPANPDYRLLAATIAGGLGDHDGAIAICQGLIRDGQATPEVHLCLGHALKTIGRAQDAVAAYRAAAVSRPRFGDAYWSLANLKTYRFDDSEIAIMRQEEAAPATPAIDRAHLCFALGKAFEDRGDAQTSWIYYERGNALMRARLSYRAEQVEGAVATQIAVCTSAFFSIRKDWGSQAADPIFVVGLPRSGSTLIEQILSSHSQVDGTHELPEIPRIVRDLQMRSAGIIYPNVLETLTRDEFAALGERYLAETRIHRAGRTLFVDKMPNNFRHIGLIHLMLPNARIIDARREPMACCFSNLKQLFADGQEFAYGQKDIAHYYRAYLALMRHWDEVLPGRVLRVHHEDVVAGLEGSVRRLLTHCGLEFEPACVSFHETGRSISTPSSEQVRRPIFRESLEAWKIYQPWLDPLRAGLGDALSGYRG